ncbi:outer membrane protein assembly factor BamE [Orrella sp. NBD-18]|uniref:Outer membrane protein assembly factor BamE n=1 Tax=Sheuella amnicola TaxID=2707330 RepID=A0A6B2QXZ0_9BURK|nr:outer membrane protein assembly factor BamE [Sheuella amnicola]HBI84029.1 outer membrane protein assembly factor BamE [Alcaligenaceae bacterium]
MFRPSAQKLYATLALVAGVTLLSGCESSRWGFPYRSGVQQGNWITKDQVALLRPGMTREQVKFALGTPMLTSALHSNRWDYPYYFRQGNGKVEERLLTVIFDKNQLASWKGDEQPELQPFQYAKQEVGRSKREEKQLQLDETRDRNDSGMPGPIQMLPGVTLDQTLGDTSVQDPTAIPGAPLDAPKQLY